MDSSSPLPDFSPEDFTAGQGGPPPPIEPDSDLRGSANALAAMLQAYLGAGFAHQDAMYLVGVFLTASIVRGRPNPNGGS